MRLSKKARSLYDELLLTGLDEQGIIDFLCDGEALLKYGLCDDDQETVEELFIFLRDILCPIIRAVPIEQSPC